MDLDLDLAAFCSDKKGSTSATSSPKEFLSTFELWRDGLLTLKKVPFPQIDFPTTLYSAHNGSLIVTVDEPEPQEVVINPQRSSDAPSRSQGFNLLRPQNVKHLFVDEPSPSLVKCENSRARASERSEGGVMPPRRRSRFPPPASIYNDPNMPEDSSPLPMFSAGRAAPSTSSSLLICKGGSSFGAPARGKLTSDLVLGTINSGRDWTEQNSGSAPSGMAAGGMVNVNVNCSPGNAPPSSVVNNLELSSSGGAGGGKIGAKGGSAAVLVRGTSSSTSKTVPSPQTTDESKAHLLQYAAERTPRGLSSTPRSSGAVAVLPRHQHQFPKSMSFAQRAAAKSSNTKAPSHRGICSSVPHPRPPSVEKPAFTGSFSTDGGRGNGKQWTTCSGGGPRGRCPTPTRTSSVGVPQPPLSRGVTPARNQQTFRPLSRIGAGPAGATSAPRGGSIATAPRCSQQTLQKCRSATATPLQMNRCITPRVASSTEVVERGGGASLGGRSGGTSSVRPPSRPVRGRDVRDVGRDYGHRTFTSGIISPRPPSEQLASTTSTASCTGTTTTTKTNTSNRRAGVFGAAAAKRGVSANNSARRSPPNSGAVVVVAPGAGVVASRSTTQKNPAGPSSSGASSAGVPHCGPPPALNPPNTDHFDDRETPPFPPGGLTSVEVDPNCDPNTLDGDLVPNSCTLDRISAIPCIRDYPSQSLAETGALIETSLGTVVLQGGSGSSGVAGSQRSGIRSGVVLPGTARGAVENQNELSPAGTAGTSDRGRDRDTETGDDGISRLSPDRDTSVVVSLVPGVEQDGGGSHHHDVVLEQTRNQEQVVAVVETPPLPAPPLPAEAIDAANRICSKNDAIMLAKAMVPGLNQKSGSIEIVQLDSSHEERALVPAALGGSLGVGRPQNVVAPSEGGAAGVLRSSTDLNGGLARGQFLGMPAPRVPPSSGGFLSPRLGMMKPLSTTPFFGGSGFVMHQQRAGSSDALVSCGPALLAGKGGGVAVPPSVLSPGAPLEPTLSVKAPSRTIGLTDHSLQGPGAGTTSRALQGVGTNKLSTSALTMNSSVSIKTHAPARSSPLASPGITRRNNNNPSLKDVHSSTEPVGPPRQASSSQEQFSAPPEGQGPPRGDEDPSTTPLVFPPSAGPPTGPTPAVPSSRPRPGVLVRAPMERFLPGARSPFMSPRMLIGGGLRNSAASVGATSNLGCPAPPGGRGVLGAFQRSSTDGLPGTSLVKPPAAEASNPSSSMNSSGVVFPRRSGPMERARGVHQAGRSPSPPMLGQPRQPAPLVDPLLGAGGAPGGLGGTTSSSSCSIRPSKISPTSSVFANKENEPGRHHGPNAPPCSRPMMAALGAPGLRSATNAGVPLKTAAGSGPSFFLPGAQSPNLMRRPGFGVRSPPCFSTLSTFGSVPMGHRSPLQPIANLGGARC